MRQKTKTRVNLNRTSSPCYKVGAASCCGDTFHQQGWRSWCELIGQWIQDNPGRKSVSTANHLRMNQQHNNPKQRKSPDLNPIELLFKTLKLMLTDAFHPIWLSLSYFTKKNGQIFQSRWAKRYTNEQWEEARTMH